MRMTTQLLACGLCLSFGVTALADDEPASPIGRKIENFTLADYRGKPHSLDDFRDSKLVVVAFTGTECPVAKLYMPRLVELAKAYEPQGVAFVAINANRQDSNTKVAAQARIHEIPFPMLKDAGNRVADQMGAIRTPEVFVLDEQRVVRYWGRIDDQYGVGYIRDEASRHDLKIALDELLAGEPVSRPVTEAPGCYIGRIREPKADAKVTYSNQIARILQQRCVECHRSGQIAPFTLTDYEDVVGWADTIAEVVRDRRMPPWHADPQFGNFANGRDLSEEERSLIYRWVSAGAPEGDPSELPEPIEYLEGWQLPQPPELVMSMRDKPFQVPAEGAVKYQYFSVDPGFTEDKWVRAAEVIPGNRAVVHHILILVRPPKSALLAFGDLDEQFLVGYVPGHRAKVLPEGYAKLIPAGSQLVFQVHYTPIGTPQEDLSQVGFLFADPETLTHQVATINAAQPRFRIPPHAGNHRVEAYSRKYARDMQVLNLMPHMHLRGKSFRYEIVRPGGERETLLDVPNYDFNWQTSYQLAEPVAFPAGSRMYCVAHYDNSENNLANPDPAREVRWGDQTWEEMMIGYFDVAVAYDPATAGDEQAAIRARAAEILAQFDKNDDGRIGRDEVPERLHRLFDLLDADRDGFVTVEELIKGVELLPRR
jgi:peroxiredoxin/mono/diheme cytochrome c family protein